MLLVAGNDAVDSFLRPRSVPSETKVFVDNYDMDSGMGSVALDDRRHRTYFGRTQAIVTVTRLRAGRGRPFTAYVLGRYDVLHAVHGLVKVLRYLVLPNDEDAYRVPPDHPRDPVAVAVDVDDLSVLGNRVAAGEEDVADGRIEHWSEVIVEMRLEVRSLQGRIEGIDHPITLLLQRLNNTDLPHAR